MSTNPLAGPLSGHGLDSAGYPIRTWRVHRYQMELLRRPERFIVMPAGRRFGKSQGAVMWVLQHGQRARLAGRKAVIWIVYPTLEVSITAWRKFRDLTPRGWITKEVGTELHPGALLMGGVTYEFKTAVAGKRLVGEGLTALWVDECAQIPEGVWTQYLRPTLIDFQAPALFTGVPGGSTWYQRMFARGLDPNDPNVYSFATDSTHGLPSHLNPFLKPAELAELIREYGSTESRLYRQEILAEFLTDEGAVFRRIEEARRRGLDTFGGMGFSSRRTASLGIDVARTQDWTVLIGMDCMGAVTHFERFNKLDWPFQKRRILQTWEHLDRPYVVIDATHGSVGDPVTQDLSEAGIGLEAFEFTSRSKQPLVEALILAFDQDGITIPDEPALVNELKCYEVTTSKLTGRTLYHGPTEGAVGDDTVMALALAYRGCTYYQDLGLTLAGRNVTRS